MDAHEGGHVRAECRAAGTGGRDARADVLDHEAGERPRELSGQGAAPVTRTPVPGVVDDETGGGAEVRSRSEGVQRACRALIIRPRHRLAVQGVDAVEHAQVKGGAGTGGGEGGSTPSRGARRPPTETSCENGSDLRLWRGGDGAKGPECRLVTVPPRTERGGDR